MLPTPCACCRPHLTQDGGTAAGRSGRQGPGRRQAGARVSLPAASQERRPRDGGRDAREDEEHRDLRPHRLGQDDADGADPVLHRADRQDPRGEGQGRGGRHHGQHGAGAPARHHHPVRGHLHHVARQQHQHHRHAGTRGLHHRGGALPPRAGRGRARAVRGGRSAGDKRCKIFFIWWLFHSCRPFLIQHNCRVKV